VTRCGLGMPPGRHSSAIRVGHCVPICLHRQSLRCAGKDDTHDATGIVDTTICPHVSCCKMLGRCAPSRRNILQIGRLSYLTYPQYWPPARPEIKLVMMIASSAIMFHMSQFMFRNAPGMEEVMREDPEIAKAVAAATGPSAHQGVAATQTATRTEPRR
jgi:hypothetical protein